MSANLMVRPCSCPARDTLCSGGQMLSMSQMGQIRKSQCATRQSDLLSRTDIISRAYQVRKVPMRRQSRALVWDVTARFICTFVSLTFCGSNSEVPRRRLASLTPIWSSWRMAVRTDQVHGREHHDLTSSCHRTARGGSNSFALYASPSCAGLFARGAQRKA